MKKHKRKTFISFFSLFLLVGITSSTALASTANNNNNTTLVASSHSSTSTQPQFNTNWDMFDSLNGDILNQSSGDEIDWTKKDTSTGIYFEDDFAYTNSRKTVLLGMDPNSEKTEITIPSSVTEIRGYTKVNSFEKNSAKHKVGAFEINTRLEKVTVAGTNVKINDNSFKNCTNLEEVDIKNNSVKSIGDSAFENCTSLEVINLPNSLNKIGKSAFKGSGLQSVDLSKTSIRNIEENVFKNCESLYEVKFSNLTQSIGSSAFEGTGITKLTINSPLTSLGYAAFKNCTSLTSFIITSSRARLTKLQDSTFEGCSSLETINFGANSKFKTIGSDVFKYTKIKTLDLTSTISIGESAFESCSYLESLTSATVLSTIGNNAFKNSSLNEITTYKYSKNDGNVNLQNILTIGSSAFYGTKIKKVETGIHLTKIGNDSFKDISSLEVVDFSKSKLLDKNENAFDEDFRSKVKWPSNKNTLRKLNIF